VDARRPNPRGGECRRDDYGQWRSIESPDDASVSLLDFLRGHLHLNGTTSSDEGGCRATVLLDDGDVSCKRSEAATRPVRSGRAAAAVTSSASSARGPTLAHRAAWDVRHANLFDRIEKTTGIDPSDLLAPPTISPPSMPSPSRSSGSALTAGRSPARFEWILSHDLTLMIRHIDRQEAELALAA
jgi:hypothetical protein